MGKPVAWFDITAKDSAKSRAFYSEVFGWKIDFDADMNYGMIDPGASEGIPGGIGEAGEHTPAGVVMYVVVDDAEETLKQIDSLGGEKETPPYDIPGIGKMAVFRDPDGNRIGLWQR
ncbi:VOC family protein [Streptosporangium sp. H16]|uniref:VOC family protein n=1 Tax=Streptosporangium sp. H16 TaxID=3444184 RepID=UPI003F78BF42